MPRLIVPIIVFLLLLAGCRYWVLYRFADQFCEFDRYVDVSQSSVSTLNIQFHEPVLNRDILLRYLNAEPFLSHYSAKAQIKQDLFHFQSTLSSNPVKQAAFQLAVDYHPVEDLVLLSTVSLDPRLSRLFTPALVEPVLRSICSDEYDLSDTQLDMFFTLAPIDIRTLPTREQIISVMGLNQTPDAQNFTSLRYELDFQRQSPEGHIQWQAKPVFLQFHFAKDEHLQRIMIRYYRYAYWLDFQRGQGHLSVQRH